MAREMDKTDTDILAELRRDCRQSYREIAHRLKLHPATVIKRVERMQREKLILGFGANLDLLALGFEFMALIDIRISKGHLLEVEQKLRSLPQVAAIYDVTGDYDAVALVACKNRADFSRMIKKILHEPYVERTNTHVILNVMKDSWEFVPF
ncbi:Lrp/AsnC family transcriptional regulator [Candidatus Micrarchaeota archaeon]|nr:Lrp/AsnC family transcriptional regulator [Candidatus Micrarchaeota archaeon]